MLALGAEELRMVADDTPAPHLDGLPIRELSRETLPLDRIPPGWSMLATEQLVD